MSTWGLHLDCSRFEHQREVVLQQGDRWPCISINRGFAPVDLGGLLGTRLRRLNPGDELDHMVRAQLEQSGFSTIFTWSSSEALDAFILGIARVLQCRRHTLDDNARPDPPVRCRVTINTRENGRRILYTKGYFISTKTNFGTSTPAQGRLPSGPYMFGMLVGGVAKYEQAVWDVYEDLEFELEVT